MDGIRASALRDDLSFIASDELQGRDSPSPGLDRAADYIADQFRRAGLEPGVGDSYFQKAEMVVETPNYDGFELKLSAGGREFTAKPSETALGRATALDLSGAPLIKLDSTVTASQVEGKVVIAEAGGRSPRFAGTAKPALVIVVDRSGASVDHSPRHALVDPSESSLQSRVPRVTLTGGDAARFFAHLKAGASDATATVHVAEAHRTPAILRNVIGVLRGSDPLLRDTCILLTAHYDHLGMKPDGPGDRIYNGANDDGSGTVSVIEIARALAQLPQHPRRSIVFMTFFGEEEGLIGSKYYANHPVWPLDKTVADLNLEQLGRTDSGEGREISNASLTGFDYSDLTAFVQDAGKLTGIKIYKDPMGSDQYFGASDNISLARFGVPAETLFVALEFPDYHAVGDEWQKIDYDNMAKVDRAVALATFLMADSEEPVRWNEANPKTAPFVKGAKE